MLAYSRLGSKEMALSDAERVVGYAETTGWPAAYKTQLRKMRQAIRTGDKPPPYTTTPVRPFVVFQNYF